MVPIARHLYKPDWAAALLLSRGVTVARQIFIFIPIHPKPPSDPPPPLLIASSFIYFSYFMIFIFGAGILFAPAAQIFALRILLRVGF